MKRSSIIAMVGATLVAASLFGGDLVRAFPAVGPDAVVATGGAPYRWHGYWSTTAAEPAGTGSLCPFRKTLSVSWDGPQLKWQRACGAPA
ncbi:hypothetical protein [Xanthobacter oligotrophicus]|uniref:hypothetical protein n=1 Tax=Xanthobacter oligotrophicus TaxID=2607286 RepID=UPI0011F389A6|nr:hypothetical protein [Xanthobacter oligotrophicus]MCG5234694.1 hypothetical protein [Xanthobacter oligotrophicus]